MTTATLSYAEQLRLAAIEEEEISLRSGYPSVFFSPNGKQEEFINLVGQHDQSSGRVITYLFSGANDTGKTRVLAEIITNLAAGVQSKWFDHGYFKTVSRPIHIRLISTEQALKQGMLKELAALLRPYLKEDSPKKEGHTYLALWELPDGSIVDVYTWQQGMTAHAGAFIDVLVLDEPGPQGIYDEATARLRRGGPVIWGCTPVDAQGGFSAEVSWFYDEVAKAESEKGGWVVIYADAEDNCQEHGIRGRVPHAVIEDRYERWKDNEAVLKARFYGRHALELGRVLKEWDAKRHICNEKDYTITASWASYSSLDFHPSRAQVYVYCKLTPWHELLVFREIVSAELIDDLAREIRKLHMVYGEPVDMTIDPLAAVQNPLTGTSVLDHLRTKHKLNFRTAGPEKSDKTAGINMLREMLRGVGGRPLIRVNDSCTLTIAQASRWMIDPKTLKPSKVEDDTWECLYRIALAIPPYPTQQGKIWEARQELFTPPLVV